jgi:hypothetical protein
MNGCLTKPLEREKLRALLEELSAQLQLQNLKSSVRREHVSLTKESKGEPRLT